MKISKNYDAIVLGIGGMGSSACYHLAQKGLDVLGLEQFSIPHSNGSSHGQTRIIRKAYFEHSDYVPLLKRSYELWRELEDESGKKIFNQCGMILYADKSSEVFKGTLRSSAEHNLPIEQMDAQEAIDRWPVYKPFQHHSVLFEPEAGFLYCERAISNYVSLAREAGAVIAENQKVLDFFTDENGVTLRTVNDKFYGKKLVITAGSWSKFILKGLNLPFQLTRKNLSWHKAGEKHGVGENVPCAFFDLGEHKFYTFPAIDGKGVKIGKHSGGEPIERPEQKKINSPDSSFEEPLERFIQTCLPHVSKRYNEFVSCIYTNTPDRNFIIDRHPEQPNIVFASGFSGHGFKFASVIGEILANLSTTGDSELLTKFIRLRAF